MKHYLTYVEEVIKRNWNRPAISNYGANGFTYGEVAAEIKKLHILFDKYKIEKGDHIAICARNSAEWCTTFFAITSYGAVAVPLLADFLPRNIAELTNISGSRLLFVDKNIKAALDREKLIEGFAEFKKIEGVTVSEDYSELIICGNKKEIAEIVWNHFPLYLPEYMLRLQFISGNDPEAISVTVKVIDEANGEILYVAVWPKDKIKFDFIDGEFAN